MANPPSRGERYVGVKWSLDPTMMRTIALPSTTLTGLVKRPMRWATLHSPTRSARQPDLDNNRLHVKWPRESYRGKCAEGEAHRRRSGRGSPPRDGQPGAEPSHPGPGQPGDLAAHPEGG